MSRPKIEINWTEVDKLGQLQCTQEEIAWFFDISVDTLDRHCKKEKRISFAEYLTQKRSVGRIRLRKKQMEMALNGSVPLLIWLGKQYLSQTEKVEQKINSDDGVIFVESNEKENEGSKI